MIGLLIIGIFQALLLVLLLLSKRGKSASDYLLAGYLLLSALLIFFTWLELWGRTHNQFLWVVNLRTPLILLIGPILWLYVKSVTEQFFRLKWKYLLTMTPFVLITLYFTFRQYEQPSLHITGTQDAVSSYQNIGFFLITGAIALSNVGYTLWGLLLIRRYKMALKTFFSSTEKINLQWLELVHFSALIAYTGISSLYIINGMFNIMSYQVLQQAGYGIASMLVLVIGFFGIRKGSIFTGSQIDFNMDRAIETIVPERLTDKENLFVHRLLEFMRMEKPHLNPEINLTLLGAKLHVSPDYLSGIINNRLNQNFYDFINHYRIEEFKRLCKDPESKKLTLISLAYDSGFQSKATFNRVFKREMHCTPGEYFNKVSTF